MSTLTQISKRRLVAASILVLAVTMLLSGCSPRKNTAASRRYQEFITRYNIHFNGDTHYRETLDDMERTYEDDYSRLVIMHPAEARGTEGVPQPQGNFDRSIEKAQKAIQLRSITAKPKKKSGRASNQDYKDWMRREEYNPFIHNSWMMMGRSQYMNGDFLGAASTFFYTSKRFWWLPTTVTEAKLWQARSYLALDWLYEAEIIIKRIKPDELTNNTLKGLYAFDYADLNLRSGNYAEAIPYLRDAVEYADGAAQRTRLLFLLGQLYARTGEPQLAYQAYKRAGSSSSAPYRTKFNARIKQSEVYQGSNIEPEVHALRRMVRYDRNKEYLDQIYYAIGNLYLSRGDTVHAIENYVLAAEKSTRSGIDKAISQITLGNLYFARHEYELAQPCYAEAVPQLPDNYPDYRMLRRRSDVLDQLATYSQNVHLQDSLLRLAEMPEEQRNAVIARIIDELKKKEKEEAEAARREEYLANQAASGSNLQQQGAAPSTFNINADNSWYFYNTATRNAGRTDFQRRWGSRKLEDNWRRRNKSSFNTDDFDTPTEGDVNDPDNPSDDTLSDGELSREELEAREHANDPHFPEYYLAQIPFTDEQKATARDVIQEGLYNMGVILKDKLEDYPAAMSEFDRLLREYPDNVYRLDTYYNIYLMYMRQGLKAQAEHYRQLILSDFPDSPYGVALRDPDYIDKLRNLDNLQEQMYRTAYDDYLNNRNDRVHEAYETMNSTYPTSKAMPRFMFLHALAYVTEMRNDDFNAVLREMLDRYPDTDLAPIASSWLRGMAQGRQLQTGAAGNMRGMIWDMRLTADSTAVAAEGPAEFDLNPDTRQLLIMTFDTDEVASNQLLYEIARHNFNSFVVRDFDLEPMNFGRLGMIIIRGFDSLNELNHYRQVMADSPNFAIPPGVRPIAISEANFERLMREGRSFEEYFRYLEEHNYIDAQAELLQPSQIITLPETEAEQTSGQLPDGAELLEEVALPEAPAPAAPATPAPQTAPPTPAAPAPAPTTAPTPVIEPGSEGDDPLFEP